MHNILDVRHDRLALSRPFRIARGEKIAADVIVVTLREDGHVGQGEGVPYARYGESVESAIAQIEGIRAAIEARAGRAEESRGEMRERRLEIDEADSLIHRESFDLCEHRRVTRVEWIETIHVAGDHDTDWRRAGLQRPNLHR